MALTVLAAIPLGILALMVLTTLGARRRGNRLPVALVSGVLFPVTWAVWYSRDEEFSERQRAGA